MRNSPVTDANSPPSPDPLEPGELASRIWERLRPYRGRLMLSLALLLASVPFVNFHPLVWGIVADALLAETLTLTSLAGWLGLMFGTYVIGLAAGAWHSFLLEKTGQAFVRDVRMDLFRKFEAQSLSCYETHVGQNGVKLSGGQRQRLSLARAFLTDPVLLLLDEPTASVEPESESLIHDSILERTRSGAGSTILVTHRIDLLRQAPRILFLDGGRLAGDAPHEVLLATCPAYADAYHRWETEEREPAGFQG